MSLSANLKLVFKLTARSPQSLKEREGEMTKKNNLSCDLHINLSHANSPGDEVVNLYPYS